MVYTELCWPFRFVWNFSSRPSKQSQVRAHLFPDDLNQKFHSRSFAIYYPFVCPGRGAPFMYENRLRFIASWETLFVNINGAISFRVLSSIRMLSILFSDDYVWADDKCEEGTATWLYHQGTQWRLVRCTIRTINIKVEIKCQLDATEVFIADLIACSTCFGHHYAHPQEHRSIIQ